MKVLLVSYYNEVANSLPPKKHCRVLKIGNCYTVKRMTCKRYNNYVTVAQHCMLERRGKVRNFVTSLLKEVEGKFYHLTNTSIDLLVPVAHLIHYKHQKHEKVLKESNEMMTQLPHSIVLVLVYPKINPGSAHFLSWPISTRLSLGWLRLHYPDFY